MILAILKIRLLQLKRTLDTLSFLEALPFPIAVIIGVWLLYKNMQLYPNYLYVLLLLVISLITIHVNRTDKSFIQLISPQTAKIYLTEYLFFTAPLLLIIGCSTHWYGLFFLLPIYLSLPFFHYTPKKNRNTYRLIALVPVQYFEWRSGMRKYFWAIASCYALAIVSSAVPFLSLLLLFLLSSIIGYFYTQCEPISILGVAEVPPQTFLATKLRTHSLLLLLFIAPIVIAYVILQAKTAWIFAILLPILLLRFQLMILLKYALYEPNTRLNGHTTVVDLYIFLVILVPILLPLLLVIYRRNYKKSLNNLKFYLDAYH